MTNHRKWVLRFRLTVLAGWAVIVASVLAGVLWMTVAGLCVLLFGVLDGMELVQRRRVKEAIREEHARTRARRQGGS